MRLSKAVCVGLVLVGLLAAALVLAPASYGQTVRRPEDRMPGLALAITGLQGGGSEIGVSVRDLDDADVERKQLASPEGVVIEDVRGQSPAAEAGLEVGDVMITFDGERIRSARQLARLVQETRSGRTVRAVVMREGARLELKVTPHMRSGPSIAGDRRRLLADPGFRFNLPEIYIPRFDLDAWAVRAVRPGRLGVRVEEIGPQLAEYFAVEKGVLVTSVTEESPGAEAGLKAGDVITSVDDWSIDGVLDLRRRLLRVEPGETFEIAVVRDKEAMTLEATLDDDDVEPRRLRLRGSRRPV